MISVTRKNTLVIASQSIDINCPGDGKCSNRGICDGTTGTCLCNEGFSGDSCESKLWFWYYNEQVKLDHNGARFSKDKIKEIRDSRLKKLLNNSIA